MHSLGASDPRAFPLLRTASQQERSCKEGRIRVHPSLLGLVTSTCSASGPLCAVPWSGAQGGRAGLQAARQPCLQPPAEGQLPPGLLSRQVRTMLFCFNRPLQSDGSWQLLLHPGVPLARRRRRRKVQRSLLPHTQAQGSSQVETLNNKKQKLNLTKTTRKVLPQRWNEIVGLQHCKVYIFDDSVIISGANLSSDYFTDR